MFSMKKINKPNFDLKTPFAQRLLEIASIEASAVVDLYGNALNEVRAISIHQELHAALSELEQTVFLTRVPKHLNLVRRSSNQLKKKMRCELITAINECADRVIAQTHSAFDVAITSDVLYEVNEAADEVTGEPFVIDSSQIPFIQHHGDAFKSLRLIRRQRFDIQPTLIKYARLVETASLPDALVESARADAAKERIAEFRAGKTRPSIAIEVLESVTTFYWSMAYGGLRAEAIPISLDPDASVITIRDVAQNFWDFGTELSLFKGATLQGKASECLKARNAWSRYQSGGVALKVISGWLRALALDPTERFCDLCYRHSAAKKRCAEHATSRYETREGRLGKQIKPFYIARARALRHLAPVQRALTAKLSEASNFPDDQILVAALSTFPVNPKLWGRVKLLASQLRQLHDLLDAALRDEIQLIFLNLVRIANAAYALSEPRSLNEERRQQQQISSANELISLKGFFKCWYAGPKIRAQDAGPPRAAYDTRHPVVTNDQLDPTALGVQILLQRAWIDAERSYRRKHLPDGAIVAEMVDGGCTLKKAASSLGYSYSGIRAMMKRWKNQEERRRNRRRPN